MNFDPVDTPRIAAGETNTDETGGGGVSGFYLASRTLYLVIAISWAAAFAEAVTGGLN